MIIPGCRLLILPSSDGLLSTLDAEPSLCRFDKEEIYLELF